MHNTWLIAKREYLERVKTKAFMIATILIPLLMGGFVFGSAMLAKKTKSTSHIVIVTKDTQLALDLVDQLKKGKGSDRTVPITRVASTKATLRLNDTGIPADRAP